MAIKIKKNGIVQDLVINANEVRVLDTDGNFRSKNLESVLKELNATGGTGTGGGSSIPKEADYVFVADSEPSYDGVWLDTSEDCTGAVEGDNGIVKAIRDYIDTDVKGAIEANKKLIDENNKVIKDIQANMGGDKLDGAPQSSNPNLLINGDFQVWNKGTLFRYPSPIFPFVVDKWQVDIEEEGHVCRTASNTIQIVPGFDDINYLRQRVENILPVGVYTLSAKIQTRSTFKMSIDINGTIEPQNQKTFTGDGDFNIYTITFNITADNSSVTIYPIHDANNIVEIEWVKLEPGSVATPFIPKSYLQELQDCLMCNDDDIAIPYSNPNLLINGDFQVWQRGRTFNLDDGMNRYTADRWRLITDSDMKLRKESYGVSIETTSAGGGQFEQYIELPKYLKGKKVTVSMKLHSPGVILNFYAGMMDSSYGGRYNRIEFPVSGGKADSFKYTFEIPNVYYDDDIDTLFVGIELDREKGTRLEIEYIKLEVGSQATPFVPRSYGEELTLCKRYYEKINYTIAGSLHRDSYETKVIFSIPFSVEKRTAPTIRLMSWYSDGKIIDIDDKFESVWRNTMGFCAFNRYGADKYVDNDDLCIDSYIVCDAEIY